VQGNASKLASHRLLYERSWIGKPLFKRIREEVKGAPVDKTHFELIVVGQIIISINSCWLIILLLTPPTHAATPATPKPAFLLDLLMAGSPQEAEEALLTAFALRFRRPGVGRSRGRGPARGARSVYIFGQRRFSLRDVF
jgi:hypothetical protein